MAASAPTYDFLIIGAGIAGLAAAIRLSRDGFKVGVLEQADLLAEIGAGLSLWGAGQVAMARLGLADQLAAKSMPWQRYEMWQGNRLAVTRPTPALSLDDDVMPYILTRSHLHQTLLEAVPADVQIILGAQVESVLEGEEGAQVTTSTDAIYSARYVIGADGADSQVRRALGDDGPLVYSGYVCYRGLAKNTIGLEPHLGTEVFAPGARVGFFALPDDALYWFAFANSAAPALPIKSVIPKLHAMHPMAGDLFDGLSFADVIECPIQHRRPFRPLKGASGRMALVGDAAHPNQPSFGMGASMALADVMLLCDLIAEAKGDVPHAMARYHQQSTARWWRMHRRHNRLGKLGQGMGALGQHALALSIRFATKG